MVIRDSSKLHAGWRFGLVAGLFLAVFAAFPQGKLIYNQNGEWNGHYAYNDIDEVAYAAYLKALIDGRPRKNDPYTGRDDSPSSPQPESLFSIQFMAPYTVAIPARIAGIAAPTAMTLSGIVAAFLSAFLCFLLILSISGSRWIGLAGSLAVLCGGALAAGEGAIGEILGTGFSYPYFPFLRRYLPAVPFAAFAGLVLVIWQMMNTAAPRKRMILCVLASLLFTFTVFSYFYIWTAAAAWLACLGGLMILARPEGWKREAAGLAALAVSLTIPLAIYAWMLTGRGETMDHVQLLVHTRAPDLFRFPVYIGVAACAVIAITIFSGKAVFRERRTIFALSLAVTSFLLFNQQVITGRSLQPIHYQVFIGNYIAALALVASLAILVKGYVLKGSLTVKAASASIATLAVVWGFVECHYTVRVLDEANVLRDRHVPAAEHLEQEALRSNDPFRDTILSVSNIHADDSPTLSPQGVLWARHQHVFAGLTWQESKERYYRYLYFQGLDDRWLEERLKKGDFVSMIALFGWGRHTDRLSSEAKPLTIAEIEEEAGRYGEFIRAFGPSEAYEPMLTHAVIPEGWSVDLSNLEKWYSLGESVRKGNQIIHRLKPIAR